VIDEHMQQLSEMENKLNGWRNKRWMKNGPTNRQ
jgi:hypothetical protein